MMPVMGPSRCNGGSTSVAVAPVAWGAQGLYALVAREPVIIPTSGARANGTLPAPAAPVDGAYVQGSPRSPSGTFLVVPTLFGLLRRDDGSGGQASYVRVKDLEGLYVSGLRECAIADGGTKLACVRDAVPSPKVVLIDTSATTPPPLPAPGED
jgi:hypothetical protein